LAAVTALVFAARRRWPALLPAWLFYLVTLSPTIDWFPSASILSLIAFRTCR